MASSENRLEGELIDKTWVRINLMMGWDFVGFWQISNTPHLAILPSPYLSTLL
ncbi:MAG: hypothetical protein AB4080_05860 [Trichodesmium sp.]